MKKKLIIYFGLFLVSLMTCAQNITVKSFRLLETDLTANFKETMEIDQNGEVAALIKVITTETGFLFDVGALGIVKQVQKPGEIWLYVPHGVMRININHQRLGRLDEPYYFQIPIQAARTYELVLTAKSEKANGEETTGGFLALKVSPTTAKVFVDDKVQTLNAEGAASVFLPYGQHTWRVEARDYQTQTGSVNIRKEDDRVAIVTVKLIKEGASDTEVSEMEETTSTGKRFASKSIYGSADFQMGGMFAFGLSQGGYWNGMNVELTVGIPFGKNDNAIPVNWVSCDDNGYYLGSYTQYYSTTVQWGAHLGYGWTVKDWLRLTPRIGFSNFVLRSEKSEVNQWTYVVSAVPSVRAEVAFNKNIGMYVTPQYNLPVLEGKIARQLRRDSPIIRSWNKGFYVTVGIWFNIITKK